MEVYVFCDWRDSFVIPPSLGEAFGTKAWFVDAIILDAEDPTRFDDFCILRSRDEYPSSILIKRCKFDCSHCSASSIDIASLYVVGHTFAMNALANLA